MTPNRPIVGSEVLSSIGSPPHDPPPRVSNGFGPTGFDRGRTGNLGLSARVGPRKGEPVISLTETATAVIGEIAQQSGVPETAGLRITSDFDASGKPALAAALTSGPGPGDEVLECGRGRVFLDPEVAARLADRVLDAERNEGGEIVFHVRHPAEA